MIKPRPLAYQWAVPRDEQALHTAARYQRPVAWCALCGARLSRYRYPGETRCAPCITQHTATLTAEELHPIHLPPLPPPDPPRKKDRATCPACGGWMYRQSKLCRRCHNRQKAGSR